MHWTLTVTVVLIDLKFALSKIASHASPWVSSTDCYVTSLPARCGSWSDWKAIYFFFPLLISRWIYWLGTALKAGIGKGGYMPFLQHRIQIGLNHLQITHLFSLITLPLLKKTLTIGKWLLAGAITMPNSEISLCLLPTWRRRNSAAHCWWLTHYNC